MNEYEEVLNHIPKSIIFKVSADNKIIKSYTGNHNLENNSLEDIFTKKQLDQLIRKDSLIWNDKEYEVDIKKISSSTFYYLHEITKYSNIQNKLKQSLENLTSKKEELQAIFDLAANGISILDRNGMFLYANKFFQKMIGYTMDELKTMSCISLSSPEYEKPSKTAVEKVIKHGTVEKFRKVCITKSGVPINASMSLSYIKSTDEIVMITSDITQDIQYQKELKKQVEIEVAKRTEQYEVMSHQSRLAAMGKMINSIAHQWRQPLNGLGLIAQGLRHIANQQDVDKTLLKETESEIMEKVSFMSQTIDDFSTFFKKSKQKEKFDVLQTTNEALRLIDMQIRTSGIKIDINDKKLIDKDIFGFPNEFRQVILNLVNNAMGAIKETKQKNGCINISLENKNNDLLIYINDNGGGIAKENINKIFDPYFTTKSKGSGIGLYMSKIIIEHHLGGTLGVRNNKNGARFCIAIKQKRI